MGRHAKPGEGCLVLGHAVAFVPLEAVAGELRAERDHDPVAGYFGDNRRCRNRQALGVALDDGARGAGEPGQAVAVDEGKAWRSTKGADGLPHGVHRRLENVVAVDPRDIG